MMQRSEQGNERWQHSNDEFDRMAFNRDDLNFEQPRKPYDREPTERQTLESREIDTNKRIVEE